MKKRLISMALAVSMAVSVVPAPVFATNIGGGGKKSSNSDPVAVQASDAARTTYVTQGNTFTDSQGVKYTITKVAAGNDSGEVEVSRQYNSLSDSITIPDTVEYSGQEYKVTSIAADAFYSYSNLTSVTIGDNITFIGARAFQCCTNLSSVTISNNVTSINNCAFNNCTSLTNIKISSSVTEIGYLVFGGCTSLNNVVIPNSVTSIGMYAFSGCTGLSNLTIPGSVTSINYGAFYNCSSLNNVTIPDGVTSIGEYAFYNCGFTEISIPKSVTSIGDCAFYSCSNLTSVTIPDSVTTIGNNAFYGCGGLKVYYTGTSDNWNAISSNFPFSAVVHYVHSVTFKDGNNIVETKLTDENGKVTAPQNNPIKEGYTFTGWSKSGSSTGLFDFNTDSVIEDTVFNAVWKKDCTLNMTVAQGEHKVNEPVTVTVTLDPGDYRSEIFAGNVSLTFTDADGKDAKDSITEVKLGDKVLADKGYNGSVSNLMQLFNPTTTPSDENSNIITVPLTVTFKDGGNYTAKLQVTNDAVDPKLNLEASAPIEIKKEEKPSTDDPNKGNDKPSTEPEKPNPDDTKKDDDKPGAEEPAKPVVTYALTVKNAEVTIEDAAKTVETTKNEDGTLTAKVPEGAKVTVKYTAPTDAIVFDLWSITSDATLDVNAKENPLTFTMPDKAVTIEAMTRDATIESEGPGVLGTAAMIGVGVAGTAVLGYQGYMIGTELYLNTVLPEGAAIPQNYGELAKLVWDNAGRPEPVALLAADASDEQKALTWAVENQLIPADKAADASVTRWEVIRAWNQVQERKQA